MTGGVGKSGGRRPRDATVEVRLLDEGDLEALHTFLASRPHTTMFLRSNLERVGLADGGRPYEGTWAAAFASGDVIGAAAHFWTGNVIVDAPDSAAAVARHAVQSSPRALMGILGPWEQVVAVRSAFDATDRPCRVESRERLFALDLGSLVAPAALSGGQVICRPPDPEEIESTIIDWRVAFMVETVGADPDEAEFEKARERLHREASEGALFVLESAGDLVATSGFNARTPDCVQIGGVYTPPELRGRGHARAVVAGSLLEARREGASSSILFTGEDNHPAQRCYASLGFGRVGDHGMVHFRSPLPD